LLLLRSLGRVVLGCYGLLGVQIGRAQDLLERGGTSLPAVYHVMEEL